MSPLERNVILSLSWFRPDGDLLGEATRSLSLLSRQAARVMGLRLLDRNHVLTPDEEIAELQAYVWLHAEEIPVIERAMWSGAWRGVLDAKPMDPEEAVAVLSVWRSRREEILSLIEATSVRVRPKPRKPGRNDDPRPISVVGPTKLAHLIRLVARESGLSFREAGWELPIWEANQIYHDLMHFEGQWTELDGGSVAGVAPVDFAGFEMAGDDENTES